MDTPIVPRAVAEAVWEEAGAWLDEPLPRRWRQQLVARANTVYARNPHFRRMIRRQSDMGRDWLWAFTRHWLAASIRRHRPHLFARLPHFFINGQALPTTPSAPPRRLKKARRILAPVRSRPRPALDYAWAAAAHFHLV